MPKPYPTTALLLAAATIAGVCTSSPTLASTRDAYASTSVNGPTNQIDHHVGATGVVGAHSNRSFTGDNGSAAQGQATAVAGPKVVAVSAAGSGANGGGSDNLASATSTDRLTLFAQNIQSGTPLTVTFAFGYSGSLDGGVIRNGGDASSFSDEVLGDLQIGGVGYGSIVGYLSDPQGIPNTPPENGTFQYTVPWENAQALDVQLSIVVDAFAAAVAQSDSAHASVNYSHTAIWLGVLSVHDAAGNEITNYTLTDENGIDWRTPGIEPGSCSADFNGDGDIGTDSDIAAFFACLAGDCCLTCGTADFNNDGDLGTDADIESFFRVLAGGAC
jgi:hypothetical protein